MRAELIPMDGGPAIPITREITVIGRREYCDVQIDHPSLSKRHCVLVRTDGLLVIRDLATTNGTRVKGQLVRWAALLPNDRITLGKLKFRVFMGPDAPAGPAEPSRPAAARSLVPPPQRGGPPRPAPKPPVAVRSPLRAEVFDDDEEIIELD